MLSLYALSHSISWQCVRHATSLTSAAATGVILASSVKPSHDFARVVRFRPTRSSCR